MINLDDQFALQKLINLEGSIAVFFVSCNYVEMDGKFTHTVRELAPAASQDLDRFHKMYGVLHRN
jgi:hypothetical protein